MKLFRYELRRLLCGKLFFTSLAVCLGFGWIVLTTGTIRGTAHTAPFSPWSFGEYLSRMLPLLCMGELCMVSVFTSRQEQMARPLTQAAPIHPRRYARLRQGAVAEASLLLYLCAAGLAAFFFAALFGWNSFGTLFAPLLLTMLPAMLFCLGLGWRLGQRAPALVWAAMGTVLLLCGLPMPAWLAFSPQAFFAEYPLRLTELDPAFSVPGAFLAGRALWCALGAALLFWPSAAEKRWSERGKQAGHLHRGNASP